FHMVQHMLPAAQLVPQYKPIGRCNNYGVLQSIPCSPECKIVGLILLDHYGEQDTLHLPVETPENPFVTPANIHTIEVFMNRVGYQGVFDKTKINILQLFHAVLNQTHVDYAALLWLEEDYHSIKDDVPLVSVYTTGNVLVRRMLIPDALLTVEIKEMGDFKKYETVFMKDTKKRKQTAIESSSRRITIKRKKESTPSIPPPGDDRERDAIAEATLLKKLDEEEIDKLVDGDDDDESSASAFSYSMLNDDGDDTGSKLEPGSHKEHLEHVSDDDEQKNDEAIEKEKEVVEIVKETNVDDEMKKKDEEVEKEKEVVEIVKETNVDDTSAKKHNEVVMEKEVVDMSGSQEIRKEQKKKPTPSPTRSPRNDLSSDKIISKELANTVTPTTATSSKTPSTTTRQKKSFIAKTRRLPGKFFVEKIKEVIQHCDKIVPELTVTKTNEMLKKEIPRLVKLAVNKDQEVSPVDISGMVSKEFAAHGPKLIEELFRKHMQNITLNLYPKTKSSTTTTSSAELQQQLYHDDQHYDADPPKEGETW
ncbi:hypothetical protein Tco_0766293, partial [Tanacetum coccineum]